MSTYYQVNETLNEFWVLARQRSLKKNTQKLMLVSDFDYVHSCKYTYNTSETNSVGKGWSIEYSFYK